MSFWSVLGALREEKKEDSKCSYQHLLMEICAFRIFAYLLAFHSRKIKVETEIFDALFFMKYSLLILASVFLRTAFVGMATVPSI